MRKHPGVESTVSLPIVTTPASAPKGASAGELRSLVAIQFGMIFLHDLPLLVLMLALLVRWMDE